jgi:hypothetical protein
MRMQAISIASGALIISRKIRRKRRESGLEDNALAEDLLGIHPGHDNQRGAVLLIHLGERHSAAIVASPAGAGRGTDRKRSGKLGLHVVLVFSVADTHLHGVQEE